MILRDDLITYLADYLKIREIQDYGPVGLQVEGRPQVRRIVTGVTACLALFEEARQREADLVLVHHGILWDRESRVVQGPFKQRLKLLLENDITLLAYHLSLDKHEEVGNNVQAAKALGMHNVAPLGAIGLKGSTEEMDFDELQQLIRFVFDKEPFAFRFGPEKIRHIGYCSGGAPDDLAFAVEEGLDAFITGEVREKTMHIAMEAGIHFFAAGHYATERLGIRALGDHLMHKMNVDVEFIDIPNPV
jgi:dinuclear metal center YbgI/SA1388 family protein